MRRSAIWWFKELVHNCVAHPLLPIGELFDQFHMQRVADVIFAFHDITIPEDDLRNLKKML